MATINAITNFFFLKYTDTAKPTTARTGSEFTMINAITFIQNNMSKFDSAIRQMYQFKSIQKDKTCPKYP